jgi:hypothetical protein
MGVFCTRRIVRSIGLYRGLTRPNNKIRKAVVCCANNTGREYRESPNFKSSGFVVCLALRTHSEALLTHSLKESIMDKALILKSIGSIGKAAKKLTTQVQETAVACAQHAIAHGDVTLADQLVEALGKGMRRASLRAWFERNTPMYIPQGKQTFAFDKERAKEMRKVSEADMTESLMALPWEEAKPEAPVTSVLNVEQVKEADITVKNAELLRVLHDAAARYHAERVLSGESAE